MAKPKIFYGYYLVAASLCIIVIATGMQVGFGIFFKPLLTEFGWTRAMTSAAFSISWIVQGLMGIIVGRFNDKLGPRVLLTVCGCLLGLSYMLMSQISNIWQIYLLYGVVIGIAMSGTLVPVVSTVARWFVARRSMMTGIVWSGSAIGTTIGAPVADWLISTYNWRVSYIILGSLVLVGIVIAAQFLRRDPAQMALLPYGEKERREKGLKPEITGLSLRQALNTRQLWIILAMSFCLAFCLFAITVHIVPYATDLGISAATAAIILATLGGLSIVGRIAIGSVADRMGNVRVIIISTAIMSLSLFWIVLAREIWGIYLFAVVFGIASSGAGVLFSPLVAELFGLRWHGSIYGVTTLGFAVGAAGGPLAAGYIFDTTGSYELAFILCAALSILGLVSAIFVKPIKDGRELPTGLHP